MKALLLTILIFFSLVNCTSKKRDDDFNKIICEKYKTDFFIKYKKYEINGNSKNGVDDFIINYSFFCKTTNYKQGVDYDVIQSYQIYSVANNFTNSTFGYELLHFKDASQIDTLISQMKEKNCVDDVTMKVHRIYRIGKNTIIGVSYSSFDITEYENFLIQKFNNKVSIEIINAS